TPTSPPAAGAPLVAPVVGVLPPVVWPPVEPAPFPPQAARVRAIAATAAAIPIRRIFALLLVTERYPVRGPWCVGRAVRRPVAVPRAAVLGIGGTHPLACESRSQAAPWGAGLRNHHGSRTAWSRWCMPCEGSHPGLAFGVRTQRWHR